MKKYILLLVLSTCSPICLAQAIITFKKKMNDQLTIIPLEGTIELKPGQEIKPDNDNGLAPVYTMEILYPLQYVQVHLNGEVYVVPVVNGPQFYDLNILHNNYFETDNPYQRSFISLEEAARYFINRYRDTNYKINKLVLTPLSDFTDSLEKSIRNHPYQVDLQYTSVKLCTYSVQKKVLFPPKCRKMNRQRLKELDKDSVYFGSWGYNYYVSTLLEDYYIWHMNMFNFPFRRYKQRDLIDFIFNEPLFQNTDLNQFLSFYKIRRLESSNDKQLLYHLADSLSQVVSNTTLKAGISAYLGKSVTRIKPAAKAPDFFLKNAVTEQFFRLGSFEGKYLVIDFWATWCGPCIKSFKSVAQEYKKYGDSVVFVSISIDEDVSKVQQFLDAHPEYPWLFLHDGENGATHVVYEAFSIPKYFLIDKKGMVLAETHSIQLISEKLKSLEIAVD